MANKGKNQKKEYGDYIVLNGATVPLKHHPTDFAVIANSGEVTNDLLHSVQRLSTRQLRASVDSTSELDQAMSDVREQSVAHHIYQVQGTNEEIVIDDHLFVTFRNEGAGDIERLLDEFNLEHRGRLGRAHILRVTPLTGMNPLKTANLIAERPEVEAAAPQVMLEQTPSSGAGGAPTVLDHQWHLGVGNFSWTDVSPAATIDAIEAWGITTGDPEIVIAVVDDGFDLGHPVFANVRIHPDKMNFADMSGDVAPGGDDFHGTPVASIILASPDSNDAMHGVAPGCTFLPIKVRLGVRISPIEMAALFRYVSKRADIVNCSFGFRPASYLQIATPLKEELEEICRTGGRRGIGLVMVFSAGNYDAPTFLEGNANVNGVKYPIEISSGQYALNEVPPGVTVYSGYTLVSGALIVAALSSRARKSGYSNWGAHITVTAPSSNSHEINSLYRRISDPRKEQFVAVYRGQPLMAANNRNGFGKLYAGEPDDADDPETPYDDVLYPMAFGGTSGAAPLVAGVAGLVLSANPALSARQVIEILKSTADNSFDYNLDLANDPNHQGITGEFVNGHSHFFGAGKVNALRAVRRAAALRSTTLPAATEIAPSSLRRAAFEPLERTASSAPTTERFLQALKDGEIPSRYRFQPALEEKKKRELWTGPENITGIGGTDWMKRWLEEKKKVELWLEPENILGNGGTDWMKSWLEEKKKVELWVEPENSNGIGAIDWLKNWLEEKKKREFELPPDFFGDAEPPPTFDAFLTILEARLAERLLQVNLPE